MSLDFPVLPPELEREIFEEVATQWPETIPSLLLVSHRVYEWIEKIKYRTVTSTGELSTCSLATLRRAIQSNSKAPSFFHTHVRHLFVRRLFRGKETENMMLPEILRVCTGIQSLAFIRCGIPSSLLPTLATLRPRQLWMRIDSLVFETDLCRPMLTCVTHLALWDRVTSIHSDIAAWLSLLAMFPSLTHLMIIAAKPSLAPHILASSKKFKVLVTYSDISGKELDNADDRYVNIGVHKFAEQWLMGTRGGNNFWARAEAFIAKKRRGEIQPVWRYWIEDADGI
ncbi:hypothetical protein C8F04DRAFT_50204 [Mycena alexandri]|uniref:Uncharacterized protein n=1 Tax=Mycena alexandri TaxID=1745969 RepID=A0AAD6SJQ9_9AGAR|nr:hypothetical protein C8F04DRAFT_50204 [Mycena alexandri]